MEARPWEYSDRMEEALFAFGPAILAVAVAVFLRMRRSRREAREEIASRQRGLAAMERPGRHLIQERERSGEAARGVSFRQNAPQHPKMEPDRWQPTYPAVFSGLLLSKKELAWATEWLYALKSVLPEDLNLGEEYVAELDGILDLLERETGSNLGRYRMSGPCDRRLLRINILALLGFCAYQLHHHQLPTRFVPAPPGAARLIH
jgi:hypothetical protein